MMDKSIENMKNALYKDEQLYNWFMNWEPDDDKGYMWSNNSYLDRLSELVNSDGHSGASFAVCCRLTKKDLKDNMI